MFAPELLALGEKYGLRRSGRYLAGPCPRCGGSSRSDKFVLRPDGSFECFACGWRGDRVQWFRDMEGRSCRSAHLAAGLRCLKTSCPSFAKCWSGKAKIRGRQPRHLHLPPQAGRATLPVRPPRHPGGSWLSWANGLIAAANQALHNQPPVLEWLAARGIPESMVDRAILGWLPHDQRPKRETLGLPPDPDRPWVWVPAGLLLPVWDSGGRLHRLRVRRPGPLRQKYRPDRKYQWIEGSGTAPMVLPTTEPVRGAVIVEAELDGLACAAAHPEVLVVAVGTVAAGVDPDLDPMLQASPVVLVALDADSSPPPQEQGKPPRQAAGPAAVARWVARYPQARYWPVPVGKDPGEYAQAGGDLGAWIEAGLPPKVPTVSAHLATPQDVQISLEATARGGAGEADEELPLAAVDDLPAFVALLRQEDGRLYYSPGGELVVRFSGLTDEDGLARRGRLRQIMYGGGLVADTLERLPRGKYCPAACIESLMEG